GNIQSPADSGNAGVGFGSGVNLARAAYNFVVFYDSTTWVREAFTDIFETQNPVARYPSGLLVRSIYWTSSLVNFYSNYTLIGSTTSDIPSATLPIDYGDKLTSGPNLGTFYWFRIRAYPPNGVMPSYSSATLSISPSTNTYPNGNIVLTASCLPSTATCEVEYPVGTVVATGTGSASYTI
ncbi:MAG: hypothetical protein ACP5MB_11745, partial [bacterium]